MSGFSSCRLYGHGLMYACSNLEVLLVVDIGSNI